MPVSNVAVGDLDVFDSGTVTVFGGDSLELTLEHPEDDDIRLVFEFREDGGEAHMDPGEIDPVEGATLYVYNHAGGDAVGPTEPFNIGVLGGRALHLIYHVDTVEANDDPTMRFSYTFYLGRPVDDDELGDRDGE
jgi:hypothetical protein